MKIVAKCWIKKCSSECIPSCKRGKNETRIVRICLLINYEIVKVSFFFLSFRNSLFLWGREWRSWFFESYNGNKFDSSLKFCSVPRNKNKNRKFSKEKNKPSEKLFFFKRVEEEKRIEFCHCQRLVIYLFQEDYIKKKKNTKHTGCNSEERFHIKDSCNNSWAILSVSRWPCFYFLFFWST